MSPRVRDRYSRRGAARRAPGTGTLPFDRAHLHRKGLDLITRLAQARAHQVGHGAEDARRPVLKNFQRRFRETNTEEGVVMETVLAYAMDQAYTSSRRTLLTEYRNSERVRWLIERGVLQLDALRNARALVNAAATVLPSPE